MKFNDFITTPTAYDNTIPTPTLSMEHKGMESEILRHLVPETELERRIIGVPMFVEGLMWGEPRYGHPEGKVLYHIPEVMQNIENVNIPIDALTRQRLRLITLTHDTFKHKEDKNVPRDWSQHHGVLARRFMENHTKDKAILETLELHDEAYYCWRLEVLDNNPRQAQVRLDALLRRVEDFLQLYYIFFKCDTRTGDKTQAPVKWFEQRIKGIEIFQFKK